MGKKVFCMGKKGLRETAIVGGRYFQEDGKCLEQVMWRTIRGADYGLLRLQVTVETIILFSIP